MKKFLLLFLTCLSVKAQLVTNLIVIPVYSGQDLFIKQANFSSGPLSVTILQPFETNIVLVSSNIVSTNAVGSNYVLYATNFYTTNYQSTVEGYYYDSNYLGYTSWLIAPQVINSTNYYFYFNLLTTNGFYNTNYFRVFISGYTTNNTLSNFYDTGNVPFSNTFLTGTNITQIAYTNFTTNVFGSNLYFGTVLFGNANTNSTNSLWLLNGRILFH